MRKIFGIGETVLDIIFKNGQPQAAKAGGSVLNSAVSMGRMKLPVSFISEYGNDQAGKLIDDFLNKNGVETSHVHRFADGNTALALAFLNEKNDAKYDFYKNYPANRLDIEFPAINRDDIVQCGSFYAIWPEIREKFRKFITASYNSGALILYDPNFRQAHDINELRPLVIENMQKASILRGSDEDFYNIFGTKGPDEAWSAVNGYCNCLVYTANVKGVSVRTSSFAGEFPVQKINPVSTIGAGDNFNAGMLTAIYRNNIGGADLAKLGERQWSEIISTAVSFATHVCMSYENYISEEYAGEIRDNKS
ncbi:MAG TPA: carbohydrate kinase [Bacteroidales bacterium]|nr:carbohydrate kinase [Bacteroidales bacterium]